MITYGNDDGGGGGGAAGGSAVVHRPPTPGRPLLAKIPGLGGAMNRLQGNMGGLTGALGGQQAAGGGPIGSVLAALNRRGADSGTMIGTAAAGGAPVSQLKPVGASAPPNPATPQPASPGTLGSKPRALAGRDGGRMSPVALGGVSRGASTLLSDLYQGRSR